MSGCKDYATTNARVDEALAIVEELIEWADADAEHAHDNGARDTERDDRRRSNILVRVRALLRDCKR